MEKKIFFFLIPALFLYFKAVAQTTVPKRHKVAIFTPLYLDSVFTAGNNYRYNKSFPKFLHAGLDFYQGAQLAIDSLKNSAAPLEVFIYDSRSRRYPLSQQINAPELSDVEMIIAHASAPDVRLLADAALKRKIPFISATLPNDAGITENPYLVILNSSLRTHSEGIYGYLQKYHSRDRIVVFKKGGTQEEEIEEHLKNFSKNTASVPLKIEFENIGNDFDAERLIRKLDSTRRTVCLAGSLDENFGSKLSQELASVSNTYPITLIGMPTWDNLNIFSKPEFKNIDIVYGTPFFYGRPDRLLNHIRSVFSAKVNGRPTDMFYRGYEVTLRFILLLLDAKKDVASNLIRKGNFVFTNFDIQPVLLNSRNMTLDYFENKKLYFVKYINGIKRVE
ncbi:MAG: amino acid ABC transporter substrate-binding protein [Chitinophagaceae bacterium]